MSDGLEHVLWIGGAQGAGKSTAARALAHRRGLRLYLVDAFTYSHAERAETGRYPTMRAFHAKTMDERWLDPEPEEMAEEFLAYSRERFRMILDDLRALPGEPPIVAEGPQLLPELVAPLASAGSAVWLVPTRGLQEALLAVRPSSAPDHTSDAEHVREKITRRNELLAEAIRAGALELGRAVVEIDAYSEASAAVDQLPGSGVTEPSAVRALRRDENLMVLDQIRRYLASDEAPLVIEGRFDFSCECSRVGCLERVEFGLDDYEKLVAEGRFLSAHEPLSGDRRDV